MKTLIRILLLTLALYLVGNALANTAAAYTFADRAAILLIALFILAFALLIPIDPVSIDADSSSSPLSFGEGPGVRFLPDSFLIDPDPNATPIITHERDRTTGPRGDLLSNISATENVDAILDQLEIK